MANVRIKDITTTASVPNDDDYLAIDGVTGGTRKILAENLQPETDTTLTIAGKAADAKVTGDEINDLKNDLSTKIGFENIGEKSYINNKDDADVVYTTGQFARTRRWLFPQIIPAGAHISEIKFKAQPTVSPRVITFEIWAKNNDSLTKVKSVELNTQEPEVYSSPKEYTCELDYDASSECMIGFLSTSYNAIYYTHYNNTTNTMKSTSDISVETTSLIYSTLGTWHMDAVATIYCEIAQKVNVVFIGNGMDYEEIQDALNDISDDSVSNPYTLLVTPKGTPYKPFSMLRSSWSASYPWSGISPRYISIIGLDRKHCVIRSNSGNYKLPCGEPMTNGAIKNLTFVMTNEDQDPTATQGGYCLHIDCRTLNDVGYNMLIEDCDFEDASGPCLGIGMHKNCTLTIKRCNFHTTLSANYAPFEGYRNLVNYGVIFCHSSTLADSTNQNIIIDDCSGICEEGNKGLWLAVAGDYDPSTASFYYRLLRNVFWNKTQNAPAYSISSGLTADPMNFGNNIP